jgi:flagellar protein FlbD
MIHLTKLSGAPFVLNAELIKYVEALPDTFITLTTGENIVVKETPEEIIHRTVEYHQHKLLIPAAARPASASESNRVV